MSARDDAETNAADQGSTPGSASTTPASHQPPDAPSPRRANLPIKAMSDNPILTCASVYYCMTALTIPSLAPWSRAGRAGGVVAATATFLRRRVLADLRAGGRVDRGRPRPWLRAGDGQAGLREDRRPIATAPRVISGHASRAVSRRLAPVPGGRASSRADDLVPEIRQAVAHGPALEAAQRRLVA